MGLKYTNKFAHISPCTFYRYNLVREWDVLKPICIFFMLNPSTADAEQDDPTIRRVVNFARRWGYGSVIIMNLFAIRGTNSDILKQCKDPIGPYNYYIWKQGIEHPFTIFGSVDIYLAWGSKGGYMNQDLNCVKFLKREQEKRKDKIRLYCLGLTKEGYPKHPLYLKKDLNLIPYTGRGVE